MVFFSNLGWGAEDDEYDIADRPMLNIVSLQLFSQRYHLVVYYFGKALNEKKIRIYDQSRRDFITELKRKRNNSS